MRNDKIEVSAVKLSVSVAKQLPYHCGEVSLLSTILSVANNFVCRGYTNQAHTCPVCRRRTSGSVSAEDDPVDDYMLYEKQRVNLKDGVSALRWCW